MSDPTLPELNRSLPIALIRAREAVMAPIREMLAESDLTEQQWRVLRVLDAFGPQDFLQVAERAAIRPPSLSRIARAMVDRGLVTQRTDRKDRRRQILRIASPGRAIIIRHTIRAAEIAETYRSALGPRRYEALLDALEALGARDAGG